MARGLKRRYKRRRTGGAYRGRRRGPKPDGMIKEVVKLTGEVRTANVQGTNDAFNTICWFDNTPPQGQSVFQTGFETNNQQFSRMMANYTYYYIYGISIKVTPYNVFPDGANDPIIKKWQIST